jgi:hypothetical protein
MSNWEAAMSTREPRTRNTGMPLEASPSVLVGRQASPMAFEWVAPSRAQHSFEYGGHPPLTRARKKLGPPGAQAHRDKPASLRE